MEMMNMRIKLPFVVTAVGAAAVTAGAIFIGQAGDIINRNNNPSERTYVAGTTYQTPSAENGKTVPIYQTLFSASEAERFQQYLSSGYKLHSVIEGDIAGDSNMEIVVSGERLNTDSSFPLPDIEVAVLDSNYEILDRINEDMRGFYVGGGISINHIISGEKPKLVIRSKEAVASFYGSDYVDIYGYDSNARKDIFHKDEWGPGPRVGDFDKNGTDDIIVANYIVVPDAFTQTSSHPVNIEMYSWEGNMISLVEPSREVKLEYATDALVEIYAAQTHSILGNNDSVKQNKIDEIKRLYGTDIFSEASEKALRVADVIKEVREVGTNSSYRQEERESMVSVMLQQDPEIGIKVAYFLAPVAFLDSARTSLGLEATYQFSEIERQILSNAASSALSGDLFGAGTGIVSALVVSEMAKNTIRSLEGNYTAPSGPTVSRGYGDSGYSYVGSMKVNNDLFTEEEIRTNVVTEARETEIQQYQQERNTTAIQQSSDPIGSLINTLFGQ